MTRKPLNCWELGYANRYDEPWFLELPIEKQILFKEQDLARATAYRHAQSTGAWDEYRALCMQQASGNLADTPLAVPVGDILQRTRESLGVVATERHAWQDDETVRRDARESARLLGLEVNDELGA